MNKKIPLFLAFLLSIVFFTACGGSTADKEWYQDEQYIKGLSDKDIGVIQKLNVNGVDHEVRLIGVDHDELAGGSGKKAHTTWEFVNLLSDSDGYSITTVWNWENGDDSLNDDFLNSNLRKALDGEGNAALSWYQKSSPTKSSAYTKPVLSMFPTSLQSVIKKVKKPIATTKDYVVNTYETKVFLLSCREANAMARSLAAEEGSTYAFYQNDDATSIVKHQVKWHDGAIDRPVTMITDGKTSKTINCAGYNSSIPDQGGDFWLRSPTTTINYRVHFADGVGRIGVSATSSRAYAVAPAFCI